MSVANGDAGRPPVPTRGGGRPAGITRAEVVAAARRMLEAGGMENLSMRRLAAELGAAPTVIYWHVGSREQLLQAVVDELLAEMQAIVPHGSSPFERLRSVAVAIRAEVRAHPYLVDLAHQLGRGPATNFPGQLALARELTAAGVRGAGAATALRAILYLVGGVILIEALPSDAGETSTRDLWRAVDDADIDPALAEAMTAPADVDGIFGFALDRLLRAALEGAG
jgi:AcrR family transcriptional regulator